MSTKCPEIIKADNLSYGWGQVFLRLMERSNDAIQPIILSIGGCDGGRAIEDSIVRNSLDAALAAASKYSVAVSAMTIFPYKHWIRSNCGPRQELFEWYIKDFLPRLRARDTANCYGTYFERMIDFHGTKRDANTWEPAAKNQLDHIIAIWRRDHEKGSRSRQSALQVSCFDPVKDHTGQKLRGFPCLQQISFSCDGNNGLAISAYYPTQYIFDRAYGNYLGLAHLGEFMAHEMGLHLLRINCFIVHPELGRNVTKQQLRTLEHTVRNQLQHEIQLETSRTVNGG